MKTYKTNYKRTIITIMFIILILVIFIAISYYRDVAIVTNICLSFLIACTTGVVIEIINYSKEKDCKKVIHYKEELKEMRRKIFKFRKDFKFLMRNRNGRNFYQKADLLMCEINKLNQQIEYIYAHNSKKSLIRKFLYNQDFNLEQKESTCDEIREDIVNETNRKIILNKINRYNNKLDNFFYNINREFNII